MSDVVVTRRADAPTHRKIPVHGARDGQARAARLVIGGHGDAWSEDGAPCDADSLAGGGSLAEAAGRDLAEGSRGGQRGASGR